MSNFNDFLPICYFKNEFIPFMDAKISIATQALHYGTAAFGGMRVVVKNGQILLFRLPNHTKRLSQSAKFLGFSITAKEIETKILEFCRLNLKKNPSLTNFYLRPLIYVADLGLSPRLHDVQFDFLIYGSPLGDYLSADGIKVCFSSWMRQSDASFPLRAKISGGYITSALAKSEAVNRGFDEAILLNNAGKVCEGSAMNLFLVRENVLITPSVDQDILEGITRQSVIEIATDLDLKVVERVVDKSELLIADEVFLTGTAAKITPINSIENYTLPKEKPITNQIKTIFDTITIGESEKYESWITRI
jgi:branched-chain amino acid aminotransferase